MSQIEIETFYPYAPELVWDALTDPDALKQWLMDNDFKAEVGHKFQFRTKGNRFWRGIVDGEVLEVVKPSRLVYSWKGDEKGPTTTVSWTLERHGDGTRLTLLHSGFTGVGGFILSKLIMGPGWKKMMRKRIPVILGKGLVVGDGATVSA